MTTNDNSLDASNLVRSSLCRGTQNDACYKRNRSTSCPTKASNPANKALKKPLKENTSGLIHRHGYIGPRTTPMMETATAPPMRDGTSRTMSPSLQRDQSRQRYNTKFLLTRWREGCKWTRPDIRRPMKSSSRELKRPGYMNWTRGWRSWELRGSGINLAPLLRTTAHFSIDTPNHKTCARPCVSTVRRPMNKTHTPRKPDEI